MEPTRKQKDGHERQILPEGHSAGHSRDGDEFLYLPSSDLTMGVTVPWSVSFMPRGGG